MVEGSSEAQLRQALAAFDAAFAAGDADELAELFAEHAQLLLLYAPAIHGRAAIRDEWAQLFAINDTSALETDYDFVLTAADLGVTLGTYTERLRERAQGQGMLVRGRIIFIWRREHEGRWQIVRALNSHSHEPEPL